MKNLKLYSEITSNLQLQSEGEVLLFSAYDIERNRFFFASSDNLIYTLHLSSFQNERAWSKGSLQAEIDTLDLEPEDVITSFDYLMEKEALIVGTSSGLLLLHTVDGKETEVVGRVEGGVKCISPSPDGDLLGVTTGFGQLLVMTHDWDLLYETALEDHPEGIDVRELDFPSRDFGSPISWRGDGKYFATLSEGSNSSVKKRLKVWERDAGALHATSEPKELMGATLEWMPSGAKIAAVCDRKAEKEGPSIVFYERNGLERSSFNINEPMDATVELLKWNCSSDLLAAIVRSGNYDSVKIWSFSNNHWYLKHDIKYLRKDGVRFMWDPTKPQQLICWTLGGQVTVYKFIWVTAVMEDSTALVIDDSKILVTPLSLSLMPPPMHLFSLNFPSPVREMAFYSMKGLVLGIVPNPAKRFSAFVQFDGGEVLEYSSKLGIARRDLNHGETSFSSSCPWMNAVLVGASELSKPLLFGLDDLDYSGLQVFLQLASEFVRQVNNLSYITEFVCAIKNENITETLYKKFLSLPYCKEQKDVQPNDFNASLETNKVSSVLLAIRRALEEQVSESPARELCILTTLARSYPPALEEALERVKFIREMELLGSDDPRRKNRPSAEEALKHLLWLSDSEAVFEAALGLYDLNLAAIVALNSQRDPKEFLPFLQELERMPALLMRYNIDLRLHRFEKALKHIVSAGDTHFADCMNLMKKNPQLFPLGLQLITDPPKRGQVLEAWGDHLSDEKCFEDAAATYLCCSSLQKALKAYRECGNWSGVLTVAGLIKLERDEVMQLAHELCEELQALGKPGEAAKIALDYCGDVNAGINLLISAREWEEALRVAFLHRREDLVSEVKNASLECASSLIDEYKEGLEKVGKYLARYLAVRQRRLLLAAKLRSEERSINDLDDDTASEASSTFSGMSVYTTGSRKSSAASTGSTVASRARDARRQRSRGKIRPGSPGEEMALVEHLKGMSLTAGAKHELRSLLISLVMLGKEETARKLQQVAENFQLSHIAAVRLAEDTVSSDSINEHAHTLERYLQKVKTEVPDADAFSWRCRVFLSP
ncbi:IKI3 family protein [Corchorus olitorius]|uniref:Elongator complex protein 1 n=1 Tax=Corchorus olitorius TaxID=93759 RepID=A0A1R3JQ04_9ROSI|nr:IKI3 family protein [Corchorus olitorius]